MEGPVARWYAKNTGGDLSEFRSLAARLASLVPPGSGFLEIAPGPGYLAIELARNGNFKVTGVDISETFVRIARENAEREGVSVDFRRGNTSAMPFDANSFDFIVCRAAFKNFSEPVSALQEMHRVLRPGGRALIIDLRRDVPMSNIDDYVARSPMGIFSRIATRLTFRFMLLKRAYVEDELRNMAVQTDFSSVEIRQADLGFEMWLTK